MKIQILVDRLKNGGGSSKSTPVQTPVYQAPPTAPEVQEAATQKAAMTPEEQERLKKEATQKGAKSLQIPATTTEAPTQGTVGTGGSTTKQP